METKTETKRINQTLIIRKNGTKRVTTFNHEPSMTDQQFAEDCDVNNIIDRFMKTGQINHLSSQQGVYADVSEIPDLQGATIIVQEANNLFNELPSDIREKFKNNPIEMMEWLSEPKNTEEAVKLGLMTKKSELIVQTQVNDPNELPPAPKSAQKTAKTPPPQD